MFDWRNAHHQLVRELGWSLFSPAITLPLGDREHPLVEEDQTMDALFREYDQRPAPLHRFVAGRRDQRLGHRFEALWEFYLRHHSFYEVMATNLQVERDGRTLGAMDMLLRDHRLDSVVHLELAVKFYLYIGGVRGPGGARWVGTNPDDDLDQKVEHLLRHQLPLSDDPATRHLLRGRGLPAPDQHCALIKGYLFHPLQDQVRPDHPISPNHLQGLWVYVRDSPALGSRFPDSRWQILPKDHWLDPSPPEGERWARISPQLTRLCEERRQPLMLHRTPPPGETTSAGPHRCLVMPPEWPISG